MIKLRIGERYIGSGEKPYFIADIGSNHDGNLDRAFKLIELAKESGADAAKFQNFSAEKIVSKEGFQSLGRKLSHQALWEKSVYDIYNEASINKEWTPLLKQKCDEVGIEYLTSPYDFDSVDLVEPYVNAYKIGSGDITWIEIIKYISKKGKPVLLSTGASTMEDVERAITAIKENNDQIVIMQCNTNYTGSLENYKYLNLNVLNEYRRRFPDSILGLSDHTSGYTAVLGAIALGASLIEKHFTDDNNRIGPDHKFAMNPITWHEMINRSLELWNALGDGIKKIEDNERESAIIQRRALYFVNNMKKGKVISKRDVFPLRPIKADGLPPYEIDQVIGKKMKIGIRKGDYLRLEDIE